MEIDKLKFDEKGLMPVIIQDATSHQVLMLAYMNRESLQKTLEGGKTCFWSRSRQKFWLKGESSGHFQIVKEIFYDCDADTLLILVEQKGVACHTGEMTCFHNKLQKEEEDKND